jgi:hypothetical protein
MKITIYEDNHKNCVIDTGEFCVHIPMDSIDVFVAALDKFRVFGDEVEIH